MPYGPYSMPHMVDIMPHMVDIMPHMVAVAFVVYINFINKTVSIPYDLNFIVHCVECIGSSTSTYQNDYVSHYIYKQAAAVIIDNWNV